MKAIGTRAIVPIMGVRDHARVAVLFGIRRRTDVRGRIARSRSALRAGECLGRRRCTSSRLSRPETWLELARDGIKRFDKEAALYIRPMYWAEHSGALLIAPDPESTKWCLSVYEAPMRKAGRLLDHAVALS